MKSGDSQAGEQRSEITLDQEILRWKLAITALSLLRQDPEGLGGMLVKCSHGPVHQAFTTYMNERFSVAHIPVNVSIERLLGGLDINQTLMGDKPVYQRGLLHTDRDALLINGAERLPTTISAVLAASLDNRCTGDSGMKSSDAIVDASNEQAGDSGMKSSDAIVDASNKQDSVSGKARTSESETCLAGSDKQTDAVLIVMDESSENDARLADTALGEKLGILIELPDLPLATLQNLVENETGAPNVESVVHSNRAADIASVDLPDTILQELTVLAMEMGIDSVRSLVFAARLARGHALLHGQHSVRRHDAVVALQLTLAPRARQLPDVSRASTDNSEEAATSNDSTAHDQQNPSESHNDDQQDQPQAEPSPGQAELPDQLLEAVQATLPQHLLAQLAAGQTIKAKTGRDQKSAAREGNSGRPTGVRRPRGNLCSERLNLLETIKCAVPRQRLRKPLHEQVKLQIRPQDFRVSRFRQPTRRTTVFVVDASGSAALHRLAEAKGAIELLLAECYIRRDRVAMITFRGQQASLDLPPTRSLVRAKRELAGLPGGGGTPLPRALELALSLTGQLRQAGEIPVVILMSDAKANITLAGDSSRPIALEESHELARQFASNGITSLFIDTSPRARPQAAELASLMNARYLPLPPGGAQALPSLMVNSS